jgi:catechol 2,3-dioxygenase-like lactoylglutathione lyase family enzyme
MATPANAHPTDDPRPVPGKAVPMTKPSRLHHVGIPVSDLDRSIAWYEHVLGLVLNKRAPSSGKELSLAVEVPEAQMHVAFLAVGDHLLLELLEYTHPRGRPYDLANCDVGAVHVCFEVDDIRAAYADLTAAGIAFNHPPIELGPDAGDLAGYWFAYFRDPDGVQLELFQLAPGTTN